VRAQLVKSLEKKRTSNRKRESPSNWINGKPTVGGFLPPCKIKEGSFRGIENPNPHQKANVKEEL